MSRKLEALDRRKARVRRALRAAANGRPRLSVFRASKEIYVQVVDDTYALYDFSIQTVPTGLPFGVAKRPL